jgi:hypothetical protein
LNTLPDYGDVFEEILKLVKEKYQLEAKKINQKKTAVDPKRI